MLESTIDDFGNSAPTTLCWRSAKMRRLNSLLLLLSAHAASTLRSPSLLDDLERASSALQTPTSPPRGRRLHHHTAPLEPPLLSLERDAHDEHDGHDHSPVNADGTLNEHALHLVRATLDSVHASVAGASGSISPEASRATLGEVKRLQGLCRAITGEDADAAWAELKREKREARDKTPAASSFAGWRRSLGDAYEDWAGPPERVAKAKAARGEAAAARLPGDFAAFRMYATTHPEIAPLLRSGRSARRELPQRLKLRDFAPDGEGGGRGGAAPPATGFGVMDT